MTVLGRRRRRKTRKIGRRYGARRQSKSLPSFMIPFAWVYIMANKNNTTLYVGVSTDLNTRAWEHKTKINSSSFTSKFNIHKLVYYEGFDQIEKAIEREKFIKGKSRVWKEALINKVNPNWDDLSDEVKKKYS
jgi:putative endonuclease